MGDYENVLPGAVLIKNNLFLTAASEQTLLFVLPSPFLLDIWRQNPAASDKVLLLPITLLTVLVWKQLS